MALAGKRVVADISSYDEGAGVSGPLNPIGLVSSCEKKKRHRDRHTQGTPCDSRGRRLQKCVSKPGSTKDS